MVPMNPLRLSYVLFTMRQPRTFLSFSISVAADKDAGVQSDPLLSRLVHVCLLVPAIIAFGTVGYIVLEGWSFFDGLFMTVITLSTVGYGEVVELSTLGRCFTSLLIFMCLVLMTLWSAAFTSFIVGNDLVLCQS